MTSFALPFALLTPGTPDHIGLAQQWKHAEEAADEYGRTLRREDWRVALPVHVAETSEQAFAEVREGYDRWLFEYFAKTGGREVLAPGARRETMLRDRVEAGGALVGSVDEVVDGIRRIQEATGGFGTLLAYVADWTSYENTDRSLELLARYVAPRINGSAARPQEAVDWAVESRRRAGTSVGRR
jgi:limonene 1,2-monooxygenase